MYKDYYRLREEPFSITPDPRFLYLTDPHREALNHMLYGITERKGFVCLTGEVGAGKTTLCRALLEQLADPAHQGRFHTALILNPMLTPTQLLKAVTEELGIETKRRDRLGYLSLLNGFLLSINSAGQDVVLIIDEAQDMPDQTLEMTRLLSNLETHKQKLLQIVLVGQEELKQRMEKPAFRQLAQRITVRFHLQTMSAHEVDQYLRHRLSIASSPACEPVKFDSSAVREIFRFSRGTPRLVNAVSDKSLLAGYVYRSGCIDKNLVRLAVQELKEAF